MRRKPSRRGGDRPTVFIVDDDEDTRLILREWLAQRYNTLCVADGEALFEELDELTPDLVVLDVKMPGPDGFRLCRELRRRPKLRDVPVLFLTGCRSDEDFARNLDAGGNAYLTKPVDQGVLMSLIDDLLQSRPLQAAEEEGEAEPKETPWLGS